LIVNMSTEETRYWPRVGLYVTRKTANEFITRMGNSGKVLDDDIEEFVESTTPDPLYLTAEVEELFNAPYESHEISNENKAILDLMQFESKKKEYIMTKKAEGLTLQEAKDAYKEALDEKVFGALPEETQQRVLEQQNQDEEE